MQRAGHQRLGRRPLGQEQRVVPGVFDLVLGGAGGALDGVGGAARNGGGQQFGEHRLGGARLADEQQPAVSGQTDDSPFDKHVVAKELSFDRRFFRAANKTAHGARRKLPAGRTPFAIGLAQRRQFVGVKHLGGRSQHFCVAGHDFETFPVLVCKAVFAKNCDRSLTGDSINVGGDRLAAWPRRVPALPRKAIATLPAA